MPEYMLYKLLLESSKHQVRCCTFHSLLLHSAIFSGNGRPNTFQTKRYLISDKMQKKPQTNKNPGLLITNTKWHEC